MFGGPFTPDGSGIPEPQHTRGEEDPVYPLQDS